MLNYVHKDDCKMAKLVKIPFIVFRLARLVFTGQASHLDTIVVLFKRPRSRQNVFTSRWPLAQKNDQRVNYKPCEYEIQASFLLSVLACWKCKFWTNSIGHLGWLSRISNFPRFHKNVNSLELWKYISENSFWRNKKKSEFSFLSWDSWYL